MEQRPLVAGEPAEPNAERRTHDAEGRTDGLPPRAFHSEDVQRVHVEPEDRLAFRVGVNILTLALLVLAGYLIWRNFIQ